LIPFAFIFLIIHILFLFVYDNFYYSLFSDRREFFGAIPVFVVQKEPWYKGSGRVPGLFSGCKKTGPAV
jgi:hypothetical protein